MESLVLYDCHARDEASGPAFRCEMSCHVFEFLFIFSFLVLLISSFFDCLSCFISFTQSLPSVFFLSTLPLSLLSNASLLMFPPSLFFSNLLPLRLTPSPFPPLSPPLVALPFLLFRFLRLHYRYAHHGSYYPFLPSPFSPFLPVTLPLLLSPSFLSAHVYLLSF